MNILTPCYALLLTQFLCVIAGFATPQDPKPTPSERKIIEVPLAVLEEYVGEYQLLPEMVMKITLEEGKIFATPTGQQKAELFPFEQDQFFLTLVDATISFSRDKDGRVSSLTVLQNGEPYVAPRNP